MLPVTITRLPAPLPRPAHARLQRARSGRGARICGVPLAARDASPRADMEGSTNRSTNRPAGGGAGGARGSAGWPAGGTLCPGRWRSSGNARIPGSRGLRLLRSRHQMSRHDLGPGSADSDLQAKSGPLPVFHGPQAENFKIPFKWLKKKSKESLMTCEDPPFSTLLRAGKLRSVAKFCHLVLVHKVLLARSHTRSVEGSFHTTGAALNGELSSLQKHRRVSKEPQIFYYLALHRNCLPTLFHP